MKFRAFIFLLSLIFTFPLCNKKVDEVTEKYNFTVNGTVYVNNVPVGNVMLEFGTKESIYIPDWNTVLKYTDENGKYNFTITVPQRTGFGSQYRIRAKNPITQSWSNYRHGTVQPEKTITENFYF
ncbi:hypothetical protein DRQ09_03785 [candidate division KSB1 bacterium]|nr:MAG: hypothetical protein DRQ09_03785 [candidate division KSB1 bacterium]